MQHKLWIALVLSIFSLLMLTPAMVFSLQPRPAQTDLWSEIGQHFTLVHHADQQADVDQQIHWYVTHPKTLQKLIANAQPYLYYVYQQVRLRHLPAELALIPIIESSYNPFVQSNVGAAGLWQMMPGTATDYGLHVNAHTDGRLNVLASTEAALHFFSDLHAYLGDWLLAIAAYDAGAGKVHATIKQNQEIHAGTDIWSLPLPDESRIYMSKLIALATIIKNPERYHITLPPIANEPYFSTVSLHQPINLHQVAKATQTDIATIQLLNPQLTQASAVASNDALLIPKDKVSLLEKRDTL